MADAPASTAKNPLELLKQKIGPLPLWVWLGAGAAIWWYFQQKQASSASAVPNQQTDPAGNIGSIDPATGYVYGTPEDNAALAANNAGTGGGSGSAGQNATTGAQTYADNNTWGIAAVNYLVGLGIDGTTANQAIQLYLSGQPLTSAQQGDVNLAIQALGSPPSLPGPVTTSTGSTSTTPVTTPAGSTTTASGSTTTGSTGSTSTGSTTTASGSGSGGSSSGGSSSSPPTVTNGRIVSLGNNRAVIAWTGTGASSWKVTRVGPGSPNGITNTVGIPQATYSGLSAGHNYEITIQPLVNGQPAGSSGKIDFKTTGT